MCSRRLFCFRTEPPQAACDADLASGRTTSRLDPPKPTQAKFGGFWRDLSPLHFTALHLPLLNGEIPIKPVHPHLRSIVGYATKEQSKDADYKVISFQWDAVTGGATKSLQDAITPSVAGKAWESAEAENCIPGWTDTAPMIQVRDANGGYDTAWYAEEGYDLDSGEMYPAWCDAEGFVNKAATVSIGQAAWILNPTGKDAIFTVSGAVASEETSVGGSANVFLLQGGGFPVEFNINDTTACTWTLTGGIAWESAEAENCIPGWTDNAPMIQIRDENGGYTTCWYAAEGYDLDSGEMYPAWCDAEGFVVKTATVPVSAGFWLWAPAKTPNVYVTVKNPVK